MWWKSPFLHHHLVEYLAGSVTFSSRIMDKQIKGEEIRSYTQQLAPLDRFLAPAESQSEKSHDGIRVCHLRWSSCFLVFFFHMHSILHAAKRGNRRRKIIEKWTIVHWTNDYRQKLGGGFIYFLFSSYLGKWSNLTNMFQRGWFNHHPEKISSQLTQKTKIHLWKAQHPKIQELTTITWQQKCHVASCETGIIQLPMEIKQCKSIVNLVDFPLILLKEEILHHMGWC